METYIRTTEVQNERVVDKQSAGARRIAAELLRNGLDINSLGKSDSPVKLRTTDDPAAMIVAVREEYARAANFTVTGDPDKVVEESVTPATSNESLEKLSDVENACLEAMNEDFHRGIVTIEDNADQKAFQDALEKDKTAGQFWKTIQRRLLANNAALLKKAVALSKLTGNEEGKGALLVGVYENGELAIRQRSQEIVNARWTQDWKDGQTDKGELRLLFHPEAMAQEGGRWAKAVEILHAVKAAGYHVPADALDYKKKGLVAASEVVTNAPYVMILQQRNKWRNAILECPDNIADDAPVRVVRFNPYDPGSYVRYGNAYVRNAYRGAVLWLRG